MIEKNVNDATLSGKRGLTAVGVLNLGKK